jgi:hypothetical protein
VGPGPWDHSVVLRLLRHPWVNLDLTSIHRPLDVGQITCEMHAAASNVESV